MKTIGFIDFFIDEWHANTYPGLIKNYNDKFGTDFVVKYAWAEVDSMQDKLTTSEWCDKMGAVKCNTIKELCFKSDYVIVLAPSNPEKHLAYAKEVFACGKNPYIDKTFAPDYATAKEIFDLAKKYNAKFFSSSALRYADEISTRNAKSTAVVTTGGGSNLPEYIIHQIEMAVKCIGKGATKVRYIKDADQEWVEVKYNDDRSVKMLYSPWMPFTCISTNDDGKSEYKKIDSPFFDNLIADILNFFTTGEVSFDVSETLEVAKIREGAIKASEQENVWINL